MDEHIRIDIGSQHSDYSDTPASIDDEAEMLSANGDVRKVFVVEITTIDDHGGSASTSNRRFARDLLRRLSAQSGECALL